MQLILASNSWIRKQLFDKAEIPYICDPPEIDENKLKGIHSDPKKLVVKLAEQKAQTTAAKYLGQETLVIGSDSVNLRDGIVYGKPKTKEEAFTMIKAASSKRDTQLTAYCVINTKTGQQWSGFEELHFDYLPMKETAIHAYLDDQKCNAYKCSGGFDIGSPFYLRHCARVEGSNGLFHAFPLERVIPILRKNGFDI
jgi:septum formation protein